MSTTIEKLDEFTKNTQKALETLSKNNEGASGRASKMEQFRKEGLGPAIELGLGSELEFTNSSSISAPGGGRSNNSSRSE